jgi:microsomal epoxide hydrolase
VLAALAGAALLATSAACAHAGGIRGARSGLLGVTTDVKIHYVEMGHGPGPTLLFVPGWTMTAEIWEPQIRRFGDAHRVVAIDPRAQGRSTKTGEGLYPASRARDIKAVIDRLKLAPVVLVGWSMGVSEAAMFVDQFGTGDLAGLVLVDSSLGGDPNPERVLAVVQWLGAVQADRAKATADFVRSMFKTPQPETYLAKVTRDALATPSSAAVALFVGSMATSTRAALAKIDKPTLIIHASSAASNPAYEQMRERIAGSRLERFESAGHALFVDEPDRFNRLIESFLNSLKK